MIWEFWPSAVDIRNLSYKKDVILYPVIGCIEEDGILEENWQIEIPKKIDYGDKSRIVVTKFQNISRNIDSGSKTCDLVVVSKLEIYGASVEPGEKIIFLYDFSEKTQIYWEIFADAKIINGKIWIYAQPNDKNVEEKLVPLFVIPFEIESFSIFGIAPKIFRLFTGLAVLSMIFVYLLMKKLLP